MNPPTKPAVWEENIDNTQYGRLAEAMNAEYEDTKRKLWWAWVCSVSLLLLSLLLGLLSVAAIFGSFYISHEFARMWYREPAELLFQFFAAFGGLCSLFCGICGIVSISDIAHHKNMLKKMK